MYDTVFLFSLAIAAAAIVLAVFTVYKLFEYRRMADAHDAEMRQRMYELAILKEVGERIGYSLNVQNIVDVILGSLHQFVQYATVSYMLIGPEKVTFRMHVEESVPRSFVDDVRNRMLSSLSALLDKSIAARDLSEVISGTFIDDAEEKEVLSFFNIPLAIGGKPLGVLTVADAKDGLYKEGEMTLLYKIVKQASDAVTRLEDVVKTEQRKLNSMVESMTEGVFMTDKEFRVVVANPAARKALRLSPDGEINMLLIAEALQGVLDIRYALEESLSKDGILSFDDVVLAGRYFQVIVAPVKSEMLANVKETLGCVIIFHDTTHDKELERMKEDFTSMMVHELRSPLDNIKKISEVLLKEEPGNGDGPNVREYMRLAYDNASTVLELVNDLLDVAKLEAGKFEITKTSQDIRNIIAERISFFEIAAKNVSVTLKTVAGAGSDQNILCDRSRVSQILNNLISNALKFTPEGGTVTIGTFMHEKGRSVEEDARGLGISSLEGNLEAQKSLPDSLFVFVSDSGTGISREDLPKLFHKFQQLRNLPVRATRKGTGLGLAVVKGITEAHGGVSGVFSKLGEGSTFYFTLPRS